MWEQDAAHTHGHQRGRDNTGQQDRTRNGPSIQCETMGEITRAKSKITRAKPWAKSLGRNHYQQQKKAAPAGSPSKQF